MRGTKMKKEVDRTAQSEVVGLVLVFGISMLGISIILVTGMPTIDNARENAQIEQTQGEFMSIDRAVRESVYTPGEAGATVSLTEGGVNVESDSVVLNLTHIPETGSGTSAEMSLGGMVYEDDNSGVAYQNGGTWSIYFDSGYSMKSPPEVSYSGERLDMRLINITSDMGIAGGRSDFSIRSNGTYKTDELRELTESPLDEGELNLTVSTEYAEPWAEYFNRTFGEDNVEPSQTGGIGEAGVVSVELSTGPPLYGVENTLNSTDAADVDLDGNVDEINISDSSLGGTYLYNYTEDDLEPSYTSGSPPDGIEDLPDISDRCYRSFEGDDLTTSPVGSGTYSTDDGDDVSGETFVAENGDISLHIGDDLDITDNTEFEATAGDIYLHVEEGLEIGSNADISVNGSNSVYLYVNEEVRIVGNSELTVQDGIPERFQVISSGDAEVRGDAVYNGTLYAQDEVDIRGGAEVRGAAVSNDVLELGGSDTKYVHDVSVRSATPPCGNVPLRNLQVTERKVSLR